MENASLEATETNQMNKDSNDIESVDLELEMSDPDVEEILIEGSNKSTQSKGTKLKKQRKNISKVWQYFEKLPKREPNEIQKCKCKKCGVTYLCPSTYGTGNMKRHIKICLKTSTQDISQLIFSQSTGSTSLRAPKFNQSEFRDLITMAIVMHDLPFTFVEYEGIRRIFRYLCPDVQCISRNTAKADVMKMFKNEKARLCHLLKDCPGRISLTADLWTSINTDGYLCVTAHFLDREWVLQKRVINFSILSPPHTGVCLTEKIYRLLTSWGIEKKLFSVTLDNASNNDAFVQHIKSQLNMNNALLSSGEFFHIRCCAHILNLIVQEGLKEVDEALFHIRESVKYFRGSQGRRQKFLDCIHHVSLDPKRGLRQDVPTRWNSTFTMLDSALYFRRALCHLQLSDSNYKHCPSFDEWIRLEKIHQFLGVFYDVTCVFSGNKYPTSNLYFQQVFFIQKALKEHMDSSDVFLQDMATQMYAKFVKYWNEFSTILSMAAVLDPRYKLTFIEFSYRKLYGIGNSETTRVREKLFALFNEYVLDSPSSDSLEKQSSRFSCSREKLTNKFGLDVMQEFAEFESQELVTPSKSQLELYLDEPREDHTKDLDVLAFWKVNQYRYPDLARMARDILCIPVSTVASESTFSTSGRVLDQYRSSLKPETVEALICTRDWLFGGQAFIPKLNESPAVEELCEDVLSMTLEQDDAPTYESHNS